MSASQPYPGTQAVLRAIALLKAFSDQQPALSLIELADTAGLNKTTAYRLLTALESEGLVTRNAETDSYCLGAEMIVLGGRALRANDLRAVSHPELETLAQQTGEAASLEVLTGQEVLILDEVPGTYLVSPSQNIGSRWPAHATSTGKVLMADLPEDELQAILRRPLPQLTVATITGPERLHRELAQVRQQGYAVADQELEVGYVAIGAPVWDHDRQVVAAVSINGPSVRLTPERISEIAGLVKATAARISERLGFRPSQFEEE